MVLASFFVVGTRRAKYKIGENIKKDFTMDEPRRIILCFGIRYEKRTEVLFQIHLSRWN